MEIPTDGAAYALAVLFERIENEYLTAERLPGSRTLRVVRTAKRVDTRKEFDACWGDLMRALRSVNRSTLTLLIDTRDAPGRNDPKFETMFAPVRAELTRGFKRVAVVVKYQVSLLQVQRNTKADGASVEVFTDLREATAWLSGGGDPPRSR